MVRALLSGRKTQTRRVVRNVPELMNERNEWCIPLRSPYGNVGDTLWVRETYALMGIEGTSVSIARAERMPPDKTLAQTDGGLELFEVNPDVAQWCQPRIDSERWKPAIFMPRWASRITLRITALRVERLQAISEADAIAEGCPAVSLHDLDCDSTPPSEHYSKLWDSINGKRVPWDLNPWVWVVCFEKIKLVEHE